jgi:sulfur-oxidizing protein SoxX
MLAGAAAGFDHVTGFAGEEWLHHRPDCPMVAVKRRRIEATVRRDRPAILAEFHDIFSHDILPDFCWRAGLTALNRGGANRKKLDRRQAGSWNLRPLSGASREYIKIASAIPPFTLSADGVYALTGYTLRYERTGNALTKTPSTKPAPIPALAMALLIGAVASASPAGAQSAVSEGQKLAFDRGKGNCLTCHEIKGGDLPGTIGPALKDIKSKYPDRNELVAILTDETKRNPQTVMPPFGRNRILTDQEINAIVDFLQTL